MSAALGTRCPLRLVAVSVRWALLPAGLRRRSPRFMARPAEGGEDQASGPLAHSPAAQSLGAGRRGRAQSRGHRGPSCPLKAYSLVRLVALLSTVPPAWDCLWWEREVQESSGSSSGPESNGALVCLHSFIGYLKW